MSQPRSRSRTNDPLEGTDVVIVDGTNLLHVLRRQAGATAVPPAATLIGRLRGVVPPLVRIELVLDGPPDPGSRDLRVASGITVRFAGRFTADALIARLVEDLARRGPAARGTAEVATRAVDSCLVVTDDVELSVAIRRLGARVAPGGWLVGLLSRTRLASPTVARPRPPQRTTPDDSDRRGWRPGRGATVKRGNPRRGTNRD